MQLIKGRYWFIIIAILLIGVTTYFFSDIVAYVLIAWVIALISEPITNLFLDKLKFRRRKWGATVSAMLTMIILLAALILLIFILVPPIITQASNLANVEFQQVIAKLDVPIQRLNDQLSQWGIPIDKERGLENIADPLRKYFSIGQVSDIFSSLIGTAGTALFGLFAVIFILFFFLRDQNIFKNFLLALTPDEYEERVNRTINESTHLLTRYFAGILLQITIITIYVSVFLAIFQIENALLIGFFAALINVIPYIGPLLGAIFGVFITVSANIDLPFFPVQDLPEQLTILSLITKLAIVFATMQLLDNLILQPSIFSNSVKAHPLEIFIVILVGGKLGGIIGMVLAIPTYTLIRVVARVFLSEFKIVQKMSKGFSMDKEAG